MSLPSNPVKQIALSGGTYNIVPDTLQSNGFTITMPNISADDTLAVYSQMSSAIAATDTYLETRNTTRPTDINNLTWHTPNGHSKGGYLEYVVTNGVTTGIPSDASGYDCYLLNFGWDNAYWASQLLLCSDGGCNETRIYTRPNKNAVGEYADWKRFAFADELPTASYDASSKTLTLNF